MIDYNIDAALDAYDAASGDRRERIAAAVVAAVETPKDRAIQVLVKWRDARRAIFQHPNGGTPELWAALADAESRLMQVAIRIDNP